MIHPPVPGRKNKKYMKRFTIFLIIIILAACTKNESGNKKTGLISGHAYFKNRFATDSSTIKPLAFTEIYIKNSGDIDENYFSKVKYFIKLNIVYAFNYIKIKEKNK